MTLSARALKALVLLALLAIVGLWVEELALLWRLLAVALLLALGLEAWWVHRSVWSLERRLPEFAELGRDFPISYRFVGPRTQLRFAEPVPSGAAGAVCRGELSAAAPELICTLKAMALGSIKWDTVRTVVLGPLGILWWPRRVDAPAAMRVEPADWRQAARTLPTDAGAQRAMKTAGEGSEHYGHRPYSPGDSLRSIDWKASARTSQTLVRLRERDEQLELALMIDLSASAERSFGPTSALHLRINSAACMAQWALRRGEQVSVVAYADRILAQSWGMSGTAAQRRLKAFFEDLQLSPVAAYPLVAADALKRQLKRRALVIWFSDLASLSHQRGLLRALNLLKSQHKSIVACPIDPKIDEVLIEPGHDWHAPNRRLAAEALKRRADLAQAELRALGVSAVFEHPDALASATFAAYARLKARRAI